MGKDPSSGYDPEYLDFIDLFNRKEYEASHQTLTEAWRHNPSYGFYKALIHLAGAFQHWYAENAFWAEDLFASAHNLLEKYVPFHAGLDIDRLRLEMRARHEIAHRALQDEDDHDARASMSHIRLELIEPS